MCCQTRGINAAGTFSSNNLNKENRVAEISLSKTEHIESCREAQAANQWRQELCHRLSNYQIHSPWPSHQSTNPTRPKFFCSFTTRATDPETLSSESSDPAPEPGSDPDDFDSKLSQVRLCYCSGTGKKAEIRKTRKSKSGSMFGSSSSGSNLYLPPVPLKDPQSGRLKVGFGFNPYSERANGRLALLGLTELLLVELVTGKSVLKYHTLSIVLMHVYFVTAVATVYIKYEKEKVSVWPPSPPPKD